MNIFVIQVMTLGEEKFIALAKQALSREGYPAEAGEQLLWPRRILEIRRAGRRFSRESALYPGYLFYRAEDLDPDFYHLIRRIPGFIRFLKDNHHIEPLSREDEELLRHFLSHGEVMGASRAYFDKDNRIRIVQGPLKGLEGRIIKVDKRKKRARVVLSLYKESYPIDLGFEIIQPAGEQG